MSIEAMSAVLNMKAPSPRDKLVLLGLANHAHRDGTSAWPGVDTLAAYADCNRRTVQRSLRALLDAGMIRLGDQAVVAHRRADQRPTVYEVALTAETREAWAKARGVNLSPRNEEVDEPDGVTSETRRGDISCTDGVTQLCHPNRPMNRPENQVPPAADAAAGGGGAELTLIPGGKALDATPQPTARDLVAAWIDGYRATHDGRDPVPALLSRVRGSCGALAKGLDLDGMRWAWQVAKQAGRDGRYDVVDASTRQGTPAARELRGSAGYAALARELREAGQ